MPSLIWFRRCAHVLAVVPGSVSIVLALSHGLGPGTPAVRCVRFWDRLLGPLCQSMPFVRISMELFAEAFWPPGWMENLFQMKPMDPHLATVTMTAFAMGRRSPQLVSSCRRSQRRPLLSLLQRLLHLDPAVAEASQDAASPSPSLQVELRGLLCLQRRLHRRVELRQLAPNMQLLQSLRPRSLQTSVPCRALMPS